MSSWTTTRTRSSRACVAGLDDLAVGEDVHKVRLDVVDNALVVVVHSHCEHIKVVETAGLEGRRKKVEDEDVEIAKSNILLLGPGL